MSHHLSLHGVLGSELELRVRDNDGYDPSVFVWIRDNETKRDVEIQLFMSEAEDLRDGLVRALDACEQIVADFRAAAKATESEVKA